MIKLLIAEFVLFGLSFDDSSKVEIEQKYVFNVLLLAVSSVRMCPVVGSFNWGITFDVSLDFIILFISFQHDFESWVFYFSRVSLTFL